MARFEFRLKTVARLREAARDAARQRVAEASRALELLREQRRTLEGQLDALVADRRRATCGESMDVPLIAAAQRYEIAVRAQQSKIDEDARAVEAELERRREALVAAERDVRGMEKLEDRLRERHAEEEQRREDRILDDFAVMRHKPRSAPTTQEATAL
ncbi:MAG: flagellar export protein FliJ [Lacipirellulaceae bacterium]